MIQHLALFKFTSSTTEEQKNNAMNQIKQLIDDIDGIIDLSVGYNFTNRSKGFEIGLTVTLKDKETLELYSYHPKHQEVIRYLNEIGLVDVLVLNYEMT